MADQADAAIGHLRLPPPKAFARKNETDPSEYEVFSKQLKAYLTLQNRRYRILMAQAKASHVAIGMPTDADDQKLAQQPQSFLILLTSDNAAGIVLRDDSDENCYETWRHRYHGFIPKYLMNGYYQRNSLQRPLHSK